MSKTDSEIDRVGFSGYWGKLDGKGVGNLKIESKRKVGKATDTFIHDRPGTEHRLIGVCTVQRIRSRR